MMMALGFFIFSLPTLAYQELQRQTKWRFAETGVVGVRPRQQFIGLGSDDITLRGELRLEVAGKAISLDYLRSMGDTGKAWPLLDGVGRVYGLFIIDSLNETKSVFLENGQAKKIDFDISLKRVDDNRVDLLGDLILDGVIGL
jgi:phage protein U